MYINYCFLYKAYFDIIAFQIKLWAVSERGTFPSKIYKILTLHRGVGWAEW